ncbi:hypothetical protein MKW98_007803, partial [Papaver atlanticum]
LMLQLGETVMFIAEAITAKLLFRALIYRWLLLWRHRGGMHMNWRLFSEHTQ